MSAKWFVVTGLCAALGLVLGSALRAEEDYDAAKEEREREEPMPESIGGIWHRVIEHQHELGRFIAQQKLNRVRDAADEIRDGANALLPRSFILETDKLARVRADVRDVAALTEDLRRAGDAGDLAAIQVHFRKLQVLLSSIASQYPAALLTYEQEEDEE